MGHEPDYQLIRRWLKKYIPNHEAEEITQEVALRISEQSKRSGRHPRSPNAYAQKIARQVFRERIDRKRQAPETEDIEEFEPQPATPEPNPRSRAEENEILKIVLNLPYPLRQVIDLKLQGYTQIETARHIRQTQAVVKHRICKALEIIRDQTRHLGDAAISEPIPQPIGPPETSRVDSGDETGEDNATITT